MKIANPFSVAGHLEMVKILIEKGKAQTATLIEELFEQEILNDPSYQEIQNYLEQKNIPYLMFYKYKSSITGMLIFVPPVICFSLYLFYQHQMT